MGITGMMGIIGIMGMGKGIMGMGIKRVGNEDNRNNGEWE